MLNIKDVRVGDKLHDRYDDYYTYEVLSINNNISESTPQYGYSHYYQTITTKVTAPNGRVVEHKEKKHFTSETRIGEFINNFLIRK